MWRFLLGAVILLASLLLIAYFVGRPIAERVFTRQVEARAAQAGADLQWGPMEFQGWGVSIPDIRLQRGPIRAAVERVDVKGALHALFSDQNWVDSVRIVGVKLTYDGARQMVASSPPSRSGSPSSDQRQLSPFEVPKVDLERLSAVIQLPGDRGTVHLKSPLFQMRQAGEQLNFGGQLEFGHGLGIKVLAKVSGAMHRPDQTITFNLAARDTVKPLIAFRLGKLRVELQGIQGHANLIERRYTVKAVGLRIRRAGRFDIEVPTVSLTRSNGETRVGVDGGLIKVSRAPQVGAKSNGAASPAPRIPVLLVPPAIQQAFASGLIFEWKSLNLELPGLPRMLKSQGVLRDQRLDAEALIGGGRFKIEVDWTDGWTRPLRASLDLLGFQLAPLFAQRLPALPPGRSRHRKLDGDVNLHVDVLALDGTSLVGTVPDLMFDFGFGWQGGRIDMPSISPDPLTRIDLGGRSHGLWTAHDDVLVMDGEMNLGDIQLQGALEVRDVRTTPLLRLAIDGTVMSCQQAFSSLPQGVLGPYENLETTGSFKPYVRFKLPLHQPSDLSLRFRGFIRDCEINALNAKNTAEIPAISDGPDALDLTDVDWLNTNFRYAVREGVKGDEEVWVGPGTSNYVPIDELPAYVGAAAYLSEEINFYKNRPLDPGLIGRAMKLNLGKNRFVYGGSTVTQQLVKNLFLVRAKSLARKVREIMVAKRITQRITRARVLELYLNCIEFGPNIFGIQAAAEHYFQKDARTVTPLEAVFLAMLKPAPSWGSWIRRRGETPSMPYWGFRTRQILQRLVKANYLTQEQADAQEPYTLYWTQGQYQDRNKPVIVPTTP
ncbi:MAG: biosynthetic peptidoglycan transglycosylase [Myxococcota bacterium]|nr:biosynthetic peptidoglycan transglycosylase [Myxococcota bacterium]